MSHPKKRGCCLDHEDNAIPESERLFDDYWFPLGWAQHCSQRDSQRSDLNHVLIGFFNELPEEEEFSLVTISNAKKDLDKAIVSESQGGETNGYRRGII